MHLAGRLLDVFLFVLSFSYLITRWRSPTRVKRRLRPPTWLLPVSALLLPMLFIPMLSTRNIVSYHGFWHLGIIESLLGGQFPPENPGFAGATISYVWFYHIWLAFLAHKTGLYPSLVNVFGHLQLLYVLLGLCVVAAESWEWSPRRGVAVFWILLACVNFGAIVHVLPFFAYWIVGPVDFLTAYSNHVAHSIHPVLSLSGTFLKVPITKKAWALLSKFYGTGAIAHGIVFFFLLAWTSGTTLLRRHDLDRWCLAVVGMAGMALFYPVFLPTAALFGAFVLLISRNLGIGLEWKRVGTLLAIAIVVCLFAAPYYLMIGSDTGASSTPVFAIGLNPSDIYYYILGPFWPALPLLAVFLYRASSGSANTERRIVVLAGLGACCVGVLFVRIAGGNANYKLVYLTAFFVAWAIVETLSQEGWRRFRPAYGVLTGGTILVCVLGWTLGPWFTDDRFDVEDGHLYLKSHAANEAISWLANLAAPGGVLLLPPTESEAKANDDYTLVALSRMPLYVISDPTWVGSTSLAKKRQAIREYIWCSRDSLGAQTLDPIDNRPIYLIYADTKEQTVAFYRDLMESEPALARFDSRILRSRLKGLGMSATAVSYGSFTILEIRGNTTGAGPLILSTQTASVDLH